MLVVAVIWVQLMSFGSELWVYGSRFNNKFHKLVTGCYLNISRIESVFLMCEVQSMNSLLPNLMLAPSSWITPV